MNLPRWEHFAHEADMGVRGIGVTKEQAFEQAARALTAVITDPDRVIDREKVTIDCEAPDNDLLLVEWLNELIYEMATRKLLFGRYRVHIDKTYLHGTAWGEPIDINKHHPTVEIKGATYTSLHVDQDSSGLWSAQCVVDV